MIRLLAVGGLALAACGGDPTPPAPLFPASYRASYVEVRNCRASADHDLDHVRVLVDPTALTAYSKRQDPFPTGAVVLKEQYDPTDTNCTGPITQWTVMVKQPEGSAPAALDWRWQRVDPARKVKTENEPRCIGCHTNCGKPPVGYQGTCAMP